MVQFRPQAKEIIAKVVYYGPPLGGKTTNLRTLYRGYPPNTRGELVVVPTGTDRTIFFDFLPVSVGTLRGMNLRVQLYTVPGQVHFNTTRQVVLRGVDGVVFVADSQSEMLAANRTSYANLKENLLLQGLALADMPHVVQFNKRDLKGILSVEELNGAVNEANAPFFEAVATVGIGVEETLQGVIRLVARSLRERFKLPFEAGAAHDGLFTHLPSQSVSIDRPFDTAKIDTPSLLATGGQGVGVEDIRPIQVRSPAPEATAEERVVPFGTATRSTGVAAQAPPPAAAREAAGDAFVMPGPPTEVFPPAVPEELDEPVFATVQYAPLDPFGAGPSSVEPGQGLGSMGGDVVRGGDIGAGGEVFAAVPPGPAEEKQVAMDAGVGEGFLGKPPTVAGGAGDLVHTIPADTMKDVFGASGPPVTPIPPVAPPLLVDPYADPFAEEVPAPPPFLVDVFSVEEPAAVARGDEPSDEGGAPLGPVEDDLVFEPLATMAVQVEVEEGERGRLAPFAPAAVQRVVPRALAQFGEVRELELEVPVPSVWVGGRRMTLQLRLTLVPEENSHVS